MNPKLPWLFAALLACLFAFGVAEGATSCLTPAAWSSLHGEHPQTTSVTQLIGDMAKRDVVLLGESHTQADHHRWQLQVLAELHAQHPNMVIGFEMFPRRVQAALDRWVAGDLTAKEFLDQADWGEVWNGPPELYLPLFEFARINRIPMVALNVDAKLNKAIMAKGWDSVPAAEREGVARPAAPVQAYRDFLFEAYREHAELAGKDSKDTKKAQTDRAFGYFVESQTTWDRAMAEALAHRVGTAAASGKILAVGIMGRGHVQYGYGVPHQLRALGIKNIGTLLPVWSDTECKELRAGLADAVFALPIAASAKAEPPRLGVRIEEKDGAVHIIEVSPGSLADKTGLKAGDHIVEVAGSEVKKTISVVAAVRTQPGGTWLPMRIRRGSDTMDVVVKFPPRP